MYTVCILKEGIILFGLEPKPDGFGRHRWPFLSKIVFGIFEKYVFNASNFRGFFLGKTWDQLDFYLIPGKDTQSILKLEFLKNDYFFKNQRKNAV